MTFEARLDSRCAVNFLKENEWINGKRRNESEGDVSRD